jgi:MFS family permease
MSSLRLLLSLRNTRLYMIAMILSFFGDGALTVAASVWVKTLTGSNSAATLVTFFIFIPIAFSPFAGLLADRIEKRKLLVVTNLVSAILLILLAIGGGPGRIWVIYLAMILYGASYVVVSTAEPALFTAILPSQALADMNSVRIAMQEGSKILAPLAGAVLFTAIGAPLVSVATAGCFLVAAAMNQAMHIPSAPQDTSSSSETASRFAVRTGFTYLWRNLPMRRVAVAGGITLFVAGVNQAVVFALIAESLHRTPDFLGVIASFQGVGSVLGGVFASILIRRYGDVAVAGFGIVSYAIGSALLLVPHLEFIFTGMTLRGTAPTLLIVAVMTIVQRRTQVHMQGRVFGSITLLLYLPQAMSLAFGAALIAVVDYRIILVVEVVGFVVLAAYLFARTRGLPDETLDPEDATDPDGAESLDGDPVK